MSFTFELASRQDEEALRSLARTSPVPGHVTVAYEREPDYFRGCLAHGPFCQVLVARVRAGGELGGMAIRAVRDFWYDGAVTPAGYLGQLRVAPRYRGRWLLPAGFRFLRELMKDGRTTSLFTTVIEGNREAETLLVKAPRPSLPRYNEVTPLLTFVIPVPARPGRLLEEVEPARPAAFSDFHSFWRARSFETGLMPVVDLGDPESSGFPDLEPESVFALREAGRIVATLGVWDCSRFKQAVVRGYSRSLRVARPALDGLCFLRGWPRLPEEGTAIRMAFGALLAVERGAEDRVTVLVRAALARARERSLDFLILAVDQRDPVRPILARFPHLLYRSRLFTVSWEGEDPLAGQLASRAVHVEPGTL